jgi:integrase
MKADITDDTTAGTQSIPKTKRNANLSADGKWRSFPKVPNLLQYVVAGTYYARCKVKGKPVRASLGTGVFTTARLCLPDKIKELRKPKAEIGTFADGRIQFERQTNSDHTLAELSKVYRLRCVESLLKSWPGLDKRKVDSIKEQEVRDWAARYAEQYAPQFFNNSLNVLRQIFTLAGIGRDANHGYKIKRLGIRSKPLELPTTEQFDRLLAAIETSGAAQAKDCADLVRFLSFTGCRVAEMKQALWRDVDWQKNEITVHSVKRRLTSGTAVDRVVPMITALRQLLERLQKKQQPQPDDRICKVSECQGALTRGCKIVACARLTHHSLRHLFATRCVESGIDIPTVARWLGHSDGGMLALKIYGHLRREHSQAMAQKVTFGSEPLPTRPQDHENQKANAAGKSEGESMGKITHDKTT